MLNFDEVMIVESRSSLTHPDCTVFLEVQSLHFLLKCDIYNW